jgi:hypothetical protein
MTAGLVEMIDEGKVALVQSSIMRRREGASVSLSMISDFMEDGTIESGATDRASLGLVFHTNFYTLRWMYLN